MRIYLDTSALAKAYIREPGSESVGRLIDTASQTFISSLNVTEMRCLLARRCRAGDFSSEAEKRYWSAFQGDVQDDVFDFVSVQPVVFSQSALLIDRIAPTPLRTLDALHLCIAERLDLDCFVTTDRQLAKAAQLLGITVEQPH